MNHTFESIRVGVFFVLGVVLIYAVYSVIGSGHFKGTDGYTLEATFEDIGTVSAGTDVRMAGVRVGQVEEARLADGKGRLSLLIDPEVRIPEDSIARITMASLLGQSYISVDYGKAGSMLEPGAEILAETGPTFTEVLAEVQQLGESLNEAIGGFSTAGSGEMGELMKNLNALVTDNRERFDTVMANLEELTGKLNRAEGTLGKLINDDGLYDELTAVVGDFRTAATDFQDSMSGASDLLTRVEQGEGTLGRLLVDDGIAADLEATADNLRKFSEDLKAGKGTLGKLVQDDTLYTELRSMMNKADQALDSVGDSGPITAVGAVSGALF
jgi:phospholipid/cholesterol/gamma-HCH transport system substrate-binding protein